jgi:trk system potassium uptake protein TrkH
VFDLRPIFLVIGILLTTLGCAMLLPALLDLALDNPDWIVFSASAGFTLFVGIALSLVTWGRTSSLNVKQAFVLTSAAWIALAAFAAIPISLSELEMSYTDAFFEAMSGLTTTGATVIDRLRDAPPGLLLWRGLLQWLGGIGIIVMAVAVLPMLQIGGMQLFRMESSDTSEKILPRATQIAGSITALYVGLTAICAASYVAAGMRVFDATVHSMTTIATGGFSNYDSSLKAFQGLNVDLVASAFMVLGSLPFVLYLQAVRGSFGAVWRDSQVRFFIALLVLLIAAAWAYQTQMTDTANWQSLRYAIFNVISIVTGTGYATTDYGQWGPFAVVFFFCIMFIGGCAGSTSCGIKIFRFQVILEMLRVHLQRILYPHGVFVPRYNGKPLADNVTAAVMSFLFLFFICFITIALALNLMGLDNITAMSSAASAMSNVGPGLGDIVGPDGNYGTLPGQAKWLLCFAMLLGRLEIFTVLVLFSPLFWRQ